MFINLQTCFCFNTFANTIYYQAANGTTTRRQVNCVQKRTVHRTQNHLWKGGAQCFGPGRREALFQQERRFRAPGKSTAVLYEYSLKLAHLGALPRHLEHQRKQQHVKADVATGRN